VYAVQTKKRKKERKKPPQDDQQPSVIIPLTAIQIQIHKPVLTIHDVPATYDSHKSSCRKTSNPRLSAQPLEDTIPSSSSPRWLGESWSFHLEMWWFASRSVRWSKRELETKR
jgi:hypothetical protein